MSQSSLQDFTEPLEFLKVEVLPEWLDFNGHMNVAHYVANFDKCIDKFLDEFGLGEDYTRSGVGSVFALQNHLHYMREVREGEKIRITVQLLDMDSKRLHVFMRMFMDDEDGHMAATSELLMIHVDFSSRRSAPFPMEAKAKLDALMESHSQLGKPRVAGHKIGTNAKI